MTVVTIRPIVITHRTLKDCIRELPLLISRYGEPSDIHIQERHDDYDFWIIRVTWADRIVV